MPAHFGAYQDIPLVCRRAVLRQRGGRKTDGGHAGHTGIIAVAMKWPRAYLADGHRYAKAGMMLSDLSPSTTAQLSLLDDHPPRPARS